MVPLLNSADAFYVGSAPVERVYLGDVEVWSAAPPPPPVAGWAFWADASKLALGPVITWPADGAGVVSTVYTAFGTVPPPQVAFDGTSGNNVVHFNLGEGKIWWTHSYTGTYPYTVFSAVRARGTMGRTVSTSYPEDGNWLAGHHGGNQDHGYAGAFTGVAATPQIGVWKRYCMDGDAIGDARIFSDHTQLGTTSPGAGQRPWNTIMLSGYERSGIQETSTFDQGELILYPFQLTAPQRTAVQQYLINKWHD